MEFLNKVRGHGDRVAVIDDSRSMTYKELSDAAQLAASALLGARSDLSEERVAFMVRPSARYAEILWGIWLAGGVAVPLCLTYTERELSDAVSAADVSAIVADRDYFETLEPLARKHGALLLDAGDVRAQAKNLPVVDGSRRALMLFTSGTTGNPKGVVSTHANISAQVRTLIDAWEWSRDDRILLTLPLHHLHGILNVVLCSLWSGATCEMHRRFDPASTWDRLSSGELTMYMGVPTIYYRLIDAWERASATTQETLSTGAEGLRLMVCGSAALPVSVLERWQAITGHTLLERYGMTELGMVLSNPLHGERKPGFVGIPLPFVDVRLVGEDGEEVGTDRPGEIQVRGPSVFLEYWGNPEATQSAFTNDGWFRTGDIAEVRDGCFRILGRESVDILKTGGEKVSALEIENVILDHPAVEECAVVGIEDPEWGERIVAAVVLGNSNPAEEDLKEWCRARLAPFKVPKEFVRVDFLPRNSMGKVQKPDLRSALG